MGENLEFHGVAAIYIFLGEIDNFRITSESFLLTNVTFSPVHESFHPRKIPAIYVCTCNSSIGILYLHYSCSV